MSEVIAYAISLSLLSTCIILFILALFFFWKKQPAALSSSEDQSPTREHAAAAARAYTLTEIDLATDNFNPRRVLGKGRFGTTYVAILKDGNFATVKRVHPWLVLSRVGSGFQSVMKSLALARHPNLVPVVGYAEGPGERIVVMEFLGTMSLEFYLHHQGAGPAPELYPVLDWGRRVRIMADVARGLDYLHEKMVVHGCVKPSNVLINERFCARICNYGLWSFLGDAGASKENDVYGFGVIVLEMLSGRRTEAGLLVRWALPLIREMRVGEFLDSRVEVPAGDLKPFIRLAKVGSACVGNSPKHRPSMTHIATIMNNLEAEVLSS